MDATFRDNWYWFIFFPANIVGVEYRQVRFPYFESVEVLVRLLQTNEWTRGRAEKKREIIKLRLNLLPFRTEATGFSFSLRPFRCGYLLNGRTGINYFPLCWRASDASLKWKSTLFLYFVVFQTLYISDCVCAAFKSRKCFFANKTCFHVEIE